MVLHMRKAKRPEHNTLKSLHLQISEYNTLVQSNMNMKQAQNIEYITPIKINEDPKTSLVTINKYKIYNYNYTTILYTILYYTILHN